MDQFIFQRIVSPANVNLVKKKKTSRNIVKQYIW